MVESTAFGVEAAMKGRLGYSLAVVRSPVRLPPFVSLTQV